MSFESLLFYVFSTVLVLSALAVITVRNPVHAVLFLVLTFFNSAAIWMMLEAEFLAIVLVLVYVGAVMVLFLFVVMMLDINVTPLREGFIRYLPVGIAVAIIMLVEMSLVVGPRMFGQQAIATPTGHGADYSNTKELGSILYTDYVYPFEIAAAVLLIAIIAAIALTMRRRPDNKYQNPAEQVTIRRNDRVRIIKMNTEKQ